MKDTKDFQERYNRWKKGERYWDIRGVELPKYDTADKDTNNTAYVYQRSDGTYYSTPTNDGAFIEDITPVLKRNLSDESTWDFVGSNTGRRYNTQYTDEQLKQIAQEQFQNSEMIPWIDRAGNKHRDINVKGLSPADPIMSFALETVAGAPIYDKAFQIGKNLTGNLVKDFARDFGYTKLGNWTRNKILSSQLNKNIKNWDGTVEMQYFNSPNNWYRWTETPEIEGIREVGKNVTTRDAVDINVPSNNWRTAAMDNYSKSKEGYWYKADIPDEDMPLSEYLNYLKNNTNKAIGSGKKYGSAHGNKSQAAYGKAWDGSLSTSGIGQLGLLEGPVGIQIPFGKTRTSFKLTPIEEVPIGGRVGFSTGEMPMDNLGWFTKLPNGRFKYNGQVLPYKRIEMLENQGKGRYQFDKPTYQIYTGPKHDISEIINQFGHVKLKNLLNIQNEALKNIPNGTIARHRLENQKWHPTDWNTFLHTRDVYKRALQYGYPGEALFPALMHDAGKLWTGNGHGPYGASIVRQIFPRTSKDQIQAIYGHMQDNPTNQLTRLVKGVDIKETNPFRTQWIMQKLQDSRIKDQFNVIPYVDDVYQLSPIKGSMFDNYNNYIYKLLNRNPEYGNIYIKEGKKLTTVGQFNPNTENSLIFYNDPYPLNTAVHEAISHKTDNLVENELTSKFIPKTDINYVNVPTSTYYTDLADVNGKGWFRDNTYEDWREMRATLNELRSMKRNIDDVSDSELILDIGSVNGYGQKYFQLLRQLDKSSRKKWLSKFRTAYKYLPVSIPIIQTLNKDDSYEKEK